MVMSSRALGIAKAIPRAMRYAISATRLLGLPKLLQVGNSRLANTWASSCCFTGYEYSVLDSCYQVDIFGPAMFYKAVGLVTSWAICIPRRLCNWDAEEAVSKVGADAAKDILASALLRMVPLRPRRVHI